MPLRGGGGSEKIRDAGEGEGGGSTFGSKGEAGIVVGPRQDPDRNPDAPPPEDAEGREEKSLGSLLVGFGAGGTVGRGGMSCLFCLSFLHGVFLCLFFVFLFVLCLYFLHRVFLCLCFVFLHVNKLMTSQFSLSKQDMCSKCGCGYWSISTSCMICDLSYGSGST